MKQAIILVSPQGDGNIGAVARAMKNFGFSDLRLIDPVDHLTDHAFTWAVNAKEILERATIHKSLSEATEDLSATFAFTRRVGRTRQASIRIDETRDIIASRSLNSPAGLIFGREDAGLTNEEVKSADFVVSIPTSKDQPSLNLAQAVLLACYEMSQFELVEEVSNTPTHINPSIEFVRVGEREKTVCTIDGVLSKLGYWDSDDNPLKSKILSQFEALFGRAGLTKSEVGMFNGLASKIIEKIAEDPKK